ncbi:helix-turn-helix domain-containing protein [Mesorhizobium sp. M1023]|uniref:helix-turn-helix domain-containing protein n=2 Tax=unclassified Mesorhizobium TaxID=325217 RepID=UPI0033359DA5
MDGRSRVCGASATRTASRSTGDGEWAERGEVTLTEAARMLNLSSATVLRQLAAGIIPAEQYCKGAPWVIKRRDIEDSRLIECVRHSRRPSSPSSRQKTLDFQ